MKAELTIIVPAFKPTLLLDTLRSIESQTNRNFRLLVVDDGSPHDIKSIVSRISSAEYHRFDVNLGGQDLVAHWNRCVLLADTQFVWLFSDDDFMEATCVESFYRVKAAYPEHAVYRFNTKREDLNSARIHANIPHPEVESAYDFLLAKIQERRDSYMPEHIFSIEAFRNNGCSFVNFPLAWNSDDASWATFVGTRGFRTVLGPTITWRFGGGNISGEARNSLRKAEADMLFAEWALEKFRLPRVDLDRMRAHRIKYHYEVPFYALLDTRWTRIAGFKSCRILVALITSAALRKRRLFVGMVKTMVAGIRANPSHG